MSIKRIIKEDKLHYFPYNYRFIKIVKKTEFHDYIHRNLEIKKLQCKFYDIYFYKSISSIL